MNVFDFFRRQSPSKARSKPQALQTEAFNFEGHSVLWRKHRRFKNLRLRLSNQDSKILVSSPLFVNKNQVIHFLESKKTWIESHSKEIKARLPSPQGQIGERHWLLGKRVELEMAPTLKSKSFVGIILDGLTDAETVNPKLVYFYPHEKKSVLNKNEILLLIETAYLKTAKKIFQDRLSFYSQAMGLQPKKLRISRAKSRWGSCSSQGTLALNVRLLAAPLWVLDSVVVHELSHLKHMNHSKDFWQLVAQFSPHHKQADQWLKDNVLL